MKKLFLAMIRFYQRKISPHTPPRCRFYPTCSQYAVEAITRYGAFRGGYLAIKRLLRCNPLCKGGIDRVPEKFSWLRHQAVSEKSSPEIVDNTIEKSTHTAGQANKTEVD